VLPRLFDKLIATYYGHRHIGHRHIERGAFYFPRARHSAANETAIVLLTPRSECTFEACKNFWIIVYEQQFSQLFCPF
jgi:hypothetical protein